MSIKVIPAVPEQKFIVCDKCSKQVLLYGLHHWLEVEIITNEEVVGWMDAVSFVIKTFHFCESCKVKMVKGFLRPDQTVSITKTHP